MGKRLNEGCPPANGTAVIARRVDDDPPQPTVEGCWATELASLNQGSSESLLHGVGTFLEVASDRCGDAEESREVAAVRGLDTSGRVGSFRWVR